MVAIDPETHHRVGHLGRGYYAYQLVSFDVGCVVDLLWPSLACSLHRVNTLAAVFLTTYVEAVLYRH